jgi:hypothetical protein
MQTTPDLHQDAARPPRRRRVILLGTGCLALVLATAGVVAALPSRTDRSAPATRAPAGATARSGRSLPRSEPPAQPADAQPADAQPADAGTGSAPALADGTYPTYVRGVNVGAATITMDVIQVFLNEAAAQAAVEDGAAPGDAQYLSIYVRNQSGRLRTLRVASDARFDFVGECDRPADRDAGLARLARQAAHFDTAYYYDVTIAGGVVHSIVQHLAVVAC